MGPLVEPVTSAERLPPQADVVIVGGGIIGTSAAFSLAQRGVNVALCEKGHIAGEQSSRNWGWCRRMGRDPRELPLSVVALRLWNEMHQLVGEDVGFRPAGILYTCDDDAAVGRRETWLKLAGDYALDTRMVAGAELERLLPGSTRKFRAALYTPSDGRAEPQKAAPAIARAAARRGATILTQCAVRGIETAAGRVSAVVTEKGRIACGSVVIAGGIWSRLLCQAQGLRLPQLAVRASVMRTAPVEGGPETAAWTPHFAFRKRLDGGYTVADGSANRYDIVPASFRYLADFFPVLKLEWKHLELRFGGRFFEEWGFSRRRSPGEISAFEKVRVMDPAPVAHQLEHARRALEQTFPVFKGVAIAQQWAGLIDALPDTVPVISPVDKLPGLFLATGFSGHGFGIGPGVGHLVADLVTGTKPVVDPSPFRYARLIDGTRPNPYTGV
ncbi:D-amino-acid oxidase [Hypericibacter adhaerens]|uniref:D-amino-acid oxidase n=1 Tax=Hypericibacter adhaerens TaxID=2602016 RepID=A0A5J6N2X7_9PROT|nr:FAD-binding oxidoreductase [Hypericibacter adhaerens]QEX24312.1 D-amino-acid oxidase [Hypericibacter adhaerens]